jgi:hypothetical protein
MKYRASMRYLGRWGLIVLIAACSYRALPAQQPKNIELIDSLLTELLQAVEQKNPVLPGDSMNVMLDSALNDYQNYLPVRIGNFFKDKHFIVFRNYDPSFSFEGLNLIINSFNCSIEYSKPYCKKFLGRSYVKRDIVLNLQGQMLKGKLNEITATLDQSAKFQDEIPEAQLAQLESSGYYFSRGQRRSYSNWSSFIEPVVTITVTSLIIYLFFTQRS